jgi:hypothetical protein
MTRSSERRAARRLDQPVEHRIVAARVRPGHDVALIDVSAGGALIETDRRLLPGSVVDLQLATRDAQVAVRGRVLRCSVSRLRAHSVSYRGAIGFDRHLPWFSQRGDVAAGSGLQGGELWARRAERAAGSPTLVG